MDEPAILCDSSSLISLTDSSLEEVIPFMANKFGIRFVIPQSVEFETVNKPLSAGLKQYAFSAIKIKHLIDNGTLVKTDGVIERKRTDILTIANNMFYTRGKPLNLIHTGEAEMLAATIEMGIQDILIDERTTRMIIEAPFKIKEHMEKEFGVSIMVNNDNLRKMSDMMRGMNVIRSSELLIIASENGFMDKFGAIKDDALEAALYKLKFSGCSIRFDEIGDYIKSIR